MGLESILVYSILSYSTLFYSILLYSILFYSTLLYSTLFYSIRSDSIPCFAVAERNAELNELGATCSFQRSEVTAFLKANVSAVWDVVICDPPKLAPSIKDLQRATRKYKQLNSLAMRAVKPGELLRLG